METPKNVINRGIIEPRFFVPESLSLEIAWAKNHRYGPGWTQISAPIACAWLWHVVEGEIRIEADGQNQTVRQGDWVWRAHGGERRVETGRQGASWRSVGLVAIRGGKNWFAPARNLVWRPQPSLAKRGDQLMTLLTGASENGSSRFERDGLARALMGWLWSVTDEANVPEFPLWLQKALQNLESEPEISVAQLARDAHFSPAHFRRLWEKQLGESPRATVARQRLEMARRFLENEEWSASEIALRSGFAGAAQFSRAFRATFGASPLEWRRLAREKL